jgi:hypothetical protein
MFWTSGTASIAAHGNTTPVGSPATRSLAPCDRCTRLS